MRRPAAVMSACPECGVVVPEDAGMCGRCGAPIESTGSLVVTGPAPPRDNSDLFPSGLLESGGQAPLNPDAMKPRLRAAPAPDVQGPVPAPEGGCHGPRDPMAAKGLDAARAAQAQGRTDDAIRILQRALVHERAPAMLHQLGVWCAPKNLPRAQDLLEEAAQLAPDEPTYRQELESVKQRAAKTGPAWRRWWRR